MLDLNKHIVSGNSGLHAHSNGLARMANGNGLGAVSKIPFSQRKQAGTSRQYINEYKHSAIGRVKAIDFQSPSARSRNGQGVNVPKRPSLERHNVLNDGGRHFSEPSTRGFNPFG